MAAVQLVSAVGEHEEQPRPQVTVEKGEQVQGRAVGPVQVLEHQQGREPVGEALQHGEEGLKQLGLTRRADGEAGRRRFPTPPELGQQEREQRSPRPDQVVEGRGLQSPAQTAEGLDHWRIRQRRLAELDAAAEQHLPTAAADPAGELADQAGLADPGFAADAQGQRIAAAGACERSLETAQLGGAADETGAGDGPGHGEEYALHFLGLAPLGRRQAVRPRALLSVVLCQVRSTP
jgi:hypothetical protein